MPRFLSRDEIAEIGVDVITRQARRLAGRFALSSDEHDDLLSTFNEVLAARLMPRSTEETSAEVVRATMWRYFDAGFQHGRPHGAGWHAATLRKRRTGTLSLVVADDEIGGTMFDVPDPAGDVWDALLRRDALRREIDDDAALERRRQVARRVLARYVRGAREMDRGVLLGRAEGLKFREIAAGELEAEPSPRHVNTMVQRYRRAWNRVPADIAAQIRSICPPPGDNERGGGRGMR